MKKRIGIIGASGYTGVELLRLLLHHPRAEPAFFSARRYAGHPVSELYPDFEGTDLTFSDEATPGAGDDPDLVFLALPHGEAFKRVPAWLEAGVKNGVAGGDEGER